MPRHRTPYPPNFRQQISDLVRAGRRPEELVKEFEPTAQTIYSWVAQAGRDAGARQMPIDATVCGAVQHKRFFVYRSRADLVRSCSYVRSRDR
jgi:transposase-like protein